MPNYDVLITEWFAAQPYAKCAQEAAFKGMISRADAFKSYETHRRQLVDQGYKFGTYGTDRSFFERLDHKLSWICKKDMNRVIFEEVKNILRSINTGSKPKPNTYSMLVMMDLKYVKPMADLVFLLTSEDATPEDLTLFWQLTDRLWCFAHPTQPLYSWHLDETCDRISHRLTQVTASRCWKVLRKQVKEVFPVADFWLKQTYKPEGGGQKRRREEYEGEGFA